MGQLARKVSLSELKRKENLKRVISSNITFFTVDKVHNRGQQREVDRQIITIEGAFTRQRENGTGPIKSGTIPFSFVKKQ